MLNKSYLLLSDKDECEADEWEEEAEADEWEDDCDECDECDECSAFCNCSW